MNSLGTLGTRLLERTFGHPSGVLGHLGSSLMAHGNAATERQIVRLAHLTSSDRVAVIGPGPGIGLQAAGEQATRAVGVEPSHRMRQDAQHRCAALIRDGRVELVAGTAEETGLEQGAFTSVLAVNNVQLWPDRPRALAELYRLLCPGGFLLLSTHEKWLPGGRAGLLEDARTTGFDEIQTWAWDPPASSASTAAQLRARRPRD